MEPKMGGAPALLAGELYREGLSIMASQLLWSGKSCNDTIGAVAARAAVFDCDFTSRRSVG